jgi:hypothetical protein
VVTGALKAVDLVVDEAATTTIERSWLCKRKLLSWIQACRIRSLTFFQKCDAALPVIIVQVLLDDLVVMEALKDEDLVVEEALSEAVVGVVAGVYPLLLG